jgi:hypothetical protein
MVGGDCPPNSGAQSRWGSKSYNKGLVAAAEKRLEENAQKFVSSQKIDVACDRHEIRRKTKRNIGFRTPDFSDP